MAETSSKTLRSQGTDQVPIWSTGMPLCAFCHRGSSLRNGSLAEGKSFTLREMTYSVKDGSPALGPSKRERFGSALMLPRPLAAGIQKALTASNVRHLICANKANRPLMSTAGKVGLPPLRATALPKISRRIGGPLRDEKLGMFAAAVNDRVPPIAQDVAR